jgi:hypothetical protein
MRLKSFLLAVPMFAMALSLPVPARAGLTSMKAKMAHMFKGDKKASDDAKAEKPAKAAAAPERKHTNGFPEKDKPGANYQPQSEPQWWGDKVWKTNANKDTWKGQ